MNVTYYGHSSFAVEISGSTLLFDPFITPNELARGVDINSIRADYVLISHAHADHLADAAAILKRTGATLIANYEITVWFAKQGCPKSHGMNHGGKARFDFGTVKFVNAIHSSSFPDGTYGGNPGGFVIESAAGNFYYAGDTALTLDMKLIGDQTPLRFAALPVGDNFTMGPADAAQAAGFLKCSNVLGVHFDTFPPIRIDHAAAQRVFQEAGVNLVLLKPGKSHQF
jgi:L-ascorbate metabolism protein UlaG (beta-lactamase superfamily)